MSNRRREPYSVYGHRREMPRITSLVALLVAIAFIYNYARKPGSWEWLANDNLGVAADQIELNPVTADVKETIVPGPTDLDAAEAEDARSQFEAVRDRAPLVATDMSAYWKCMKWARAQSFNDLNARSATNVKYADLWERPAEYRGKPIRLRLHIRRILESDAPKNSADVKKTYEIWGWTDQSRSHPYVVVVSELPPGMEVGEEVEEEGLFVGYFLKTMAYTAALKPLAAPLLLGRVYDVGGAPLAATSTGPSPTVWAGGIASAAAVLFAAYFLIRKRQRGVVGRAPSSKARHDATSVRDDSEVVDWFENQAVGSDDEPPDFRDRRG